MSFDLEHKARPLDLKSFEDGVISGYASIFGEVDTGGDMVMPGAYGASLDALRAKKQRVKMLWQHDPCEPIGVWDEVAEDDKGLFVKGRLLPDLRRGAEVATMLKEGVLDGLSIGYDTVAAGRGPKGERQLQKLNVWEVSVVTFPMQQSARIDGVKAVEMSTREIERKLTQDAGFTRSVARALMGGGMDAIKAMRDAGGGIGDLAQFMRKTLKKEN